MAAKFNLVSMAMLLAITASYFGHPRGDTAIEDRMSSAISIQCFDFAGNAVQKNYGLWTMQPDGLWQMRFAPTNPRTTEIDCHFVTPATGAHQWFSVYRKSGLAVACGNDCLWTIRDLGFFLRDPATNGDVQAHLWLWTPDNWVEPHL